MLNLGKITANDKLVIETAVDEFIKDGYRKLTNDKSVARTNRDSAKSLRDSLKNNEAKLHIEQLRIMYIALVLFQDEMIEAESTGFKDGMQSVFKETFDKLIPKLEFIVDSML